MTLKIKYEYLLFLIALIWALFFSYVIQLKPGFSLTGDDQSYLTAAKELYLELKLNDGRPLFISSIIGFPLLFHLPDELVIKWGIFINFSCWFFTILLIFKIISERLDRKKAFLFSIFFILCIGNLAIAFNLLSESLFNFMLVLAVFFINKYFESEKHHFITIGIAVLLLAILVKPMAIGLVFILLIFHYRKLKVIVWKSYIIYCLLSLSLLFFQMYALKKNYGDFTISYIDSITYYNYLGGKADCLKKNIEYIPGKNERAKYFSKFSSHEQRKIAKNDMKEQLINNKLNLFKSYLFCIYSNSSKGSYIVSECKNANQTLYFDFFYFLFKAISKVQNIFFTIIGVLASIYCLVKGKNHSTLNSILSIMILYVFFISAISCFQCDRFHIIFFPLVILLLSKYLETNKVKLF